MFVNLDGDVDSDLNTEYWRGGQYQQGGLINIGGIDFSLSLINGVDTGVIGGLTVSDGETEIDDVNVSNSINCYIIANSAWGTEGENIGYLKFFGARGELYEYDFIVGENIRDHNNGLYENNVTSSNLIGTFETNPVRLDAYKITLPSSFIGDTVTSISFRNYGLGNPGGSPFLAAITFADNRNPVVSSALVDFNVTEGVAFSFQLSAGAFSDPDGDTLSYSARLASNEVLPSWLRFNSLTRTFTGTAPIASSNYTVRVTANDGQGGTISDDFVLTTRAQANAITMAAVGRDTHTSEGGDTASYRLALNNRLVAGSLSVKLTSLDPSEGQFLINGQVVSNQIVTFDSTHQSFTITVQGMQDYLADGTAPYRISAVATNGTIRAASDQGSWTSAISTFNDTGAHYENLFNDPDLSTNGQDRDVALRLNGNQIEDDNLLGLDGNDRLYGWGGDDRLDGGIGNDTVYGGYGDDELYGGAGNDKLYGEQDVDYLVGGLGDDTLDGGLGADTMIGGSGNDTYYVDDTEDSINDQGLVSDLDAVIVTQTIRYTLPTNVENASLDSSSGNSSLIGNALNNSLTGNLGKNSLSGGAGNDTLNGGGGNDTLNGGAGNDTYIIDSARDVITDASGLDMIIENLDFYTLAAGIEKLSYTGSGSCSLAGNALDNMIAGGAGNDSLSGGMGNDTLIGGIGRDTMTGGTEADVFRISSLNEAGDRINDFQSGADKLQFVSRNFSGLTSNQLSQGRFVVNRSGNASGFNAQFIFNTQTGVLSYDANGASSGGATVLVTLNSRTLSVNDFLMVAS